MARPDDLPDNLSRPAKRALANAGYATLTDVATVAEARLLELHGVGSTAVTALRGALAASGRSFVDATPPHGGLR